MYHLLSRLYWVRYFSNNVCCFSRLLQFNRLLNANVNLNVNPLLWFSILLA
jgi:hypothetical protein